MKTDPSRSDLIAVASFAERFAQPDFSTGEWIAPKPQEDGVIHVGWWSPSQTVAEWGQALYDHQIVDPDSDYLDQSNVDFVNRSIREPALIADLDLPSLRRVLTFLARAERHADGGWYESAFKSGMAQAATRRRGELAASASAGE